MKTPRGYMQGYDAQAVATEQQIVIAAEVSADSSDFGHLAGMVDAAERELEQASDKPSLSRRNFRFARDVTIRLVWPSDHLRGSVHMGEVSKRISAAALKRLLEAFNAHDVDAVMGFFVDDCILDMPRGPELCGRRMEGRDQVRRGLASRFAGIPDVHYGDDRHWVAGDRGCSEWLLTGTTTEGERIAVRGCDLFEFRVGKILRKDSYWKIIEPPKL